MAGDWLKIEVSLPDKPEVWEMAGILSIDPDAVVGKLLKVWRWFDAHTESGNASGVTFALVDSKAGVKGFAEAMNFVGWLIQDGRELRLPNFDRHNGKTAKNRALTAKRVASHKGKINAQGNDASVSDALPREEKRREEKKDQKALASPAGSRLPDDWTPPEDWLAWARSEKPGINALQEADKFRDFWHGKAGKDGRKANWQATWRNWIRNSRQANGYANSGYGSNGSSEPVRRRNEL